MPDAPEWIQLEFAATAEDFERIEDAFFASGALALSYRDAGDQALFEFVREDNPIWDEMIVQALFAGDVDQEHLLGDLAKALGDQDWQLKPLPNQDWHRAWMDRYEPIQFGERLWVCPSWKPVPEACTHPIKIDPGTAFGTGTHPTTALCLEWLDAKNCQGLSVVDFGAGSGILAIAAGLLGASSVLAVDNDPDAVAHCADNVEANALSAVIRSELSTGYRSESGGSDLVMANILARPLVALSSEIKGLMKPGGELVLSGILHEQIDSVIAAYSDTIHFAEPTIREDWVLLYGRKAEALA